MSNSQKSVSTGVGDQESLSDLIVDSIQDIKGKKIVKLDLRHLDDRPADYFIVCEGDSSVQIRAIAENISKRAKEELSMPPNHIEGKTGSNWILVDFFDVVAHVFHPEARAYYQVEDLWNDAHSTEYEDL